MAAGWLLSITSKSNHLLFTENMSKCVLWIHSKYADSEAKRFLVLLKVKKGPDFRSYHVILTGLGLGMVLASITFLSLTIFGVTVTQQQPMLTNQSTRSNGSNITEKLSNHSMQQTNGSNESDQIYSQCLEIAASSCDSMFTN
jgi:hypothetical protein